MPEPPARLGADGARSGAATTRARSTTASADDLPTLVWLANLADLELHTSLALRRRRQGADDGRLRPRPRAAGDDRRVRRGRAAAARGVRAPRPRGVPEDVGLEGHAGLRAAQHAGHLRTDTKPFARALAQVLERRQPELVRLGHEARRCARARCFVDWSQNDEHKTTVNVYSLRARERPTVSTPLHWDEVEGVLDARPRGARVHLRRGARAGRRARRPVRAGGRAASRSCRWLPPRPEHSHRDRPQSSSGALDKSLRGARGSPRSEDRVAGIVARAESPARGRDPARAGDGQPGGDRARHGPVPLDRLEPRRPTSRRTG